MILNELEISNRNKITKKNNGKTSFIVSTDEKLLCL